MKVSQMQADSTTRAYRAHKMPSHCMLHLGIKRFVLLSAPDIAQHPHYCYRLQFPACGTVCTLVVPTCPAYTAVHAT